MTQYQMDNSTVRPERIVLLAVDLTDFAGNRVVRQNDFQAAVAEAKELIRATGGELVETVTCQKDRPSPALFIGSGKAEEIAELIETLEADLLVVNHPLSLRKSAIWKKPANAVSSTAWV